MTVTATPYGAFLTGLMTGAFDLDSDTYKISLHTASYTPLQDTHDFYDDVTAETSGTGYTAGGKTLSGLVITYDTTNNWSTLAADSVTWTVLSASFRYAVVYKSTGTSSTSRLVGYLDYATTQTVTASDFVINFTAGLLRLRSLVL